ncbi:MAG: prepilin peptidase [Caldimicrobium sp.]|nr:prepilin peptidase [Caldimicrobium sp.]
MKSTILIFLIGLILGSFINVLIYRIPRKESIIRPYSRCPQCKTPLRWYHNIPLFSYLLLRGRCAFCKESIPWHYPLVELLCPLLMVTIYHKLSTTYGYQTFLIFAFFVLLLVTISFIDLFHKEIPDILSFPLLFGGWIFSMLGINPFVMNFEESLVSSFTGMGLLFFINELYYRYAKRDGMGMGDFKLMGGLGAFIGYKSFFNILFLASLIGLVSYAFFWVYHRKFLKRATETDLMKTEIPFGPFLSLSAIIYLLYPQSLL